MEQINLSILDEVLDRYQEHLDATRPEELYKWEAVRHFKETYDPNADNLPAMLEDAYQVRGKDKLNLAFGPSWFPIGMLSWFIGVDPNGTLAALDALYDEERDLKTRMVAFEAWAKGMLESVNAGRIAAGDDPAKSHFQDPRSMSLYLAFVHPEAHYLYKTRMYTEAAEYLGVGWPGNKFDKVIAYRGMCDQILEHLEKTRPELIEESDATLGDLAAFDPAHHMLVQDIVYYIATYDKDYRDGGGEDGGEPPTDEWYPSADEYDPGIDADTWVELLGNPEVFTESALEIVCRMRDYGGSATCTQLAQEYGETKNFYNSGSVALAKRVAETMKCPLPDDQENSRWWPVLYVGKPADKDEVGSYVWKLRDELAEALGRVDLSRVKLHAEEAGEEDVPQKGDPDSDGRRGHWLLVANAKIWSFFGLEVGARTSYTIYNDKGNPRRIHKNYLAARQGDPIIGYESSPTRRIVALCEVTQEHDDERLYFHKVSDIENGLTFEQIKSDPVLSKCEFSKNPNGSFFALTEEEYARFVELMGIEGKEDADTDNPIAPADEPDEVAPYTDENFLSEVYVSSDDLTDMKALLERKRNLILQGSPGTGKTFCARRLAWAMMGCKDDTRITFVQFHQSTTYDDFVCGYRPDGNGGFQIKDGPFVRACHAAAGDPERPHFVIIDEINRANISKVLGELLMLIEAEHRGESALLTVSGKELMVPKNLYIIGMMNTADRGLALIDYALRRRFAFFEMEPALEHAGFLEQLGKSGDPRMAALVEATREVNKDIAADAALGDGFRIGHSYFCGADDARLVLRYELAPLVREYWFDDPKKVRQELDKLEGALK